MRLGSATGSSHRARLVKGVGSRTSRRWVAPMCRGGSAPRLTAMPSLSPPKGVVMFSRRGTLAVVCLATAMLMLDIAVVNTALPKIASSLDAGISGLRGSWTRTRSRSPRSSSPPARSPIASGGGGSSRPGSSSSPAPRSGARPRGASSCSTWREPCRASAGAILFATSLALLADAFPEWNDRSKALAVYGATIGASFAVGPAVGGALTSYLGWRWVFYVNIPVGIAGRGHLPLGARVA